MSILTANVRGVLLGLAGFGLFSVADGTIKFLGGTYHPVQIVAFASLFTLPLVGLLWLKTRARLHPVHPWLMAIRTVALIINALMVTYAFTSMPLAEAYAIFFTMPLVLTLLAWPVLGDRVDALSGAAVLLGLLGVIVALNPGRIDFGIGHIAAVLAMLMAAVHYLIIRRTGSAESSVAMLLYPVLGQSLAAFLLLPSSYQPMPLQISPPWQAFRSLAWPGRWRCSRPTASPRRWSWHPRSIRRSPGLRLSEPCSSPSR